MRSSLFFTIWVLVSALALLPACTNRFGVNDGDSDHADDGGDSSGEGPGSGSGRTIADTTPLAPVALDAVGRNGNVELGWSPSAEPAKIEGFLLVSSLEPSTWVPMNGEKYSVGQEVGNVEVISSGPADAVQHSGVTNGTSYHYRLFSYSKAFLYSKAATISAVPKAWAPAVNNLVNATSLAPDGKTLYLGGSFTFIGPYTGHGNLLDLETGGRASTTFWPDINGDVLTAIADPGVPGAYFIGGEFARIGNIPRSGIARLLPNGAVDPSWVVELNGRVTSLTVAGNDLIFGGSFSKVNGSNRTRLARVGLKTAALDPTWAPEIWHEPNALVADSDRLYVAGRGGRPIIHPRPNLKAISLNGSGTSFDWYPLAESNSKNLTNIDDLEEYEIKAARLHEGNLILAGGDYWDGAIVRIKPDNTVEALVKTEGEIWDFAIHESKLYVAARSYRVGMVMTDSLSRYHYAGGVATFDSAWAPINGGAVSKILFVGTQLYVSGSAVTCRNQAPRGYFARINPEGSCDSTFQTRSDVPALTLASSGNTLLAGGSFQSLLAEPRNFAAAIDLEQGTVLPWAPNPNNSVESLTILDQNVYLGGNFWSVGGLSRDSVVKVDRDAGAVDPDWHPDPNGKVLALDVHGDNIIMGGEFTKLGTVSRGYAAKVSPDGSLHAWNPKLNGAVTSIAVTPERYVLGGAFTVSNGSYRYRVVAFDSNTDKNVTTFHPSFDNVVSGLAPCPLAPKGLFIAGNFTKANLKARAGLIRVEENGTYGDWDALIDRPLVEAVAADATSVYVGGDFRGVGGSEIPYLAKLDPTNGKVLSSFSVPLNSRVKRIFAHGNRIFVSGYFKDNKKTGRAYFISVDANGNPN